MLTRMKHLTSSSVFRDCLQLVLVSLPAINEVDYIVITISRSFSDCLKNLRLHVTALVFANRLRGYDGLPRHTDPPLSTCLTLTVRVDSPLLTQHINGFVSVAALYFEIFLERFREVSTDYRPNSEHER